jgi:hypothetical protein
MAPTTQSGKQPGASPDQWQEHVSEWPMRDPEHAPEQESSHYQAENLSDAGQPPLDVKDQARPQSEHHAAKVEQDVNEHGVGVALLSGSGKRGVVKCTA